MDEIASGASSFLSSPYANFMGILISLGGAVVTVFFALRAERAALSARDAATGARLSVLSADYILLTAQLREEIDSLKDFLAADDYIAGSRQCSTIRSKVILVLRSPVAAEDESIHSLLDDMRSDLGELADTCDRENAGYKPMGRQARSNVLLKLNKHLERLDEVHARVRRIVESQNVR